MILKFAARSASRGGRRGGLSVLLFHRVLAAPDPMLPSEPTVEEFDAILGWLRDQVTLLPLDEAVRRLRDGTLPAAAAAITFDDGYRDNCQLAAPVLQHRGVPATFFVASGFLNGGIMWNDAVIEAVRETRLSELSFPRFGLPSIPIQGWAARRKAMEQLLGAIKYLPDDRRIGAVDEVCRVCAAHPRRDLMMSSAEVRSLSASGFEIGAHTVSHPILRGLPDAVAVDEIRTGRAHLEAIVGRRIGLFAYPNGRWLTDFDQRHIEMVEREGFDAAFSTEHGVGRSAVERFAMPRFTPWDRSRTKFGLRLVRNMAAPSRRRTAT